MNSIKYDIRVFTKNIARLMEQNKVPITELADRLNIGVTTTSRIVYGQIIPTPKTVKTIAAILGVDKGVLWK